MAAFTRRLFGLGVFQLLAAIAAFWAAVEAVKAAKQSAKVAASNVDHLRIVERAYVKLSHEPFDGTGRQVVRFEISNGEPPSAWIGIQVTVKNEGSTPADVMGGGIWCRLELGDRPNPETPPNYPARIAPAFLTGGGGDFVRFETSFRMPVEPDLITMRQTYNSTQKRLWVIGHVDYRDRFGAYHRAGYCRRFENTAKDLVHDQTTSGLNYDRALSKEEQRQYEA
jgi:hypothetical protein